MSEMQRIKRKIVLVGDGAVGKTSLARRFVYSQFSDNYLMTVGFKVSSKKIIYTEFDNNSGVELTLMIWDIMGQKGYSLTPQTAFLGAKGAILVCDLTRKETLLDLPTLTTSLFGTTKKIPVVFIANKKDLVDKHEFTEKGISDIATTYHAPYYVTSAKTGENVELAFKVLGEMILKEQDL